MYAHQLAQLADLTTSLQSLDHEDIEVDNVTVKFKSGAIAGYLNRDDDGDFIFTQSQ